MDKVVETYTQNHWQAGGADSALGFNEFWNYGLWLPGTRDPRQASKQLLKHLIDQFPPGTRRVLDVGFGLGASTRRLCNLFGPENVVGINIGADQVEAARRMGVTCDLRVMDAAHLDFDDGTFDAILCMEAAQHFRPRAAFIKHAHRVLGKGGRLVMSDVLFRSGYGLDPQVFPPENRVASVADYRRVFVDAGFSPDQIAIEETGSKQLFPFAARLAQEAGFLSPDGLVSPDLKFQTQPERWRPWFLVTRLLNVLECAIVQATK